MADVSDGTSHTYLAGEKYIPCEYYENGCCESDNESAFIGDNGDVCRWTELAPMQDTPGYYTPFLGFGSAHANGLHMAFCDGSVQLINYTIELEIHQYLSNRKDGVVIDAKEY